MNCSCMDPWGCSKEAQPGKDSTFEDNFEPVSKPEKLEDSAEYLAVLERKLQALRKKNKVLDNLTAYREDCINRLLRDGCDLEPVIGNTEADKLIDKQDLE